MISYSGVPDVCRGYIGVGKELETNGKVLGREEVICPKWEKVLWGDN